MAEYIHQNIPQECERISPIGIDTDGKPYQISTLFERLFDYKKRKLLVVQLEQSGQNESDGRYVVVPGFVKIKDYRTPKKTSENETITVSKVSKVPMRLQPEIRKMLEGEEDLEGKIGFW